MCGGEKSGGGGGLVCTSVLRVDRVFCLLCVSWAVTVVAAAVAVVLHTVYI